MTSPRKLGVGIIGAGEVFQVCHGPCLLLLSHLFRIESICDLSPRTVDHCAEKFFVPHKTTTPQEVINHPRVELVFILTSDESHAPLAIASLQAGKNVFTEKPVSLSLPAVESIIQAERHAPRGARVFVGYMRRYAPSYLQAFKSEVATIPKILYARVRDFSGPNSTAGEERLTRLETLFAEAFPNQEVTDEKRKYCRFLGSLGSHDISLMRETLGFPEKVVGVSVNDPFYSAIMAFRNADGSTYSTTYESGIDEVSVFDAHIAVYGEKKRVTIKYDSPYIKGLPVYVEVDEMNDNGEVQRRTMLSSYEDAYTAELQEVYEAFTTGTEIKTTVADAKKDLEIYDMMYKKME